MVEVYPNLYVGGVDDEQAVRGAAGWFLVHACREPHHRALLGYKGRGAPADHPEYLFARRPGSIALNLVDVDDVNLVQPEVMSAGVAAIRENLPRSRVLVHCNQGWSRAPTIALLFMAEQGAFDGIDYDSAAAQFRQTYPAYGPKDGMRDYARAHWPRLT